MKIFLLSAVHLSNKVIEKSFCRCDILHCCWSVLFPFMGHTLLNHHAEELVAHVYHRCFMIKLSQTFE